LRCIASFYRYIIDEIENSDCAKIYESMLRQGRIWDFRDIFIGAVFYYGQEQACDEFFGSSENPLNRILRDWSTAIYDESTNLALLDILVSLVLVQPLSLRTIAGTKRVVDSASVLVSSIIQNHPSNLKSRQYIQWILAKVAVTSYRTISSSVLSEFPGLFLPKAVALDLYIYIPAASETPDWHLLCLPSKSFETLQIVLKVARELEDLETEALCLKQLIAHSRDPIEYFDDLIHLQKIKQKDMKGWLETCLSKYLICRDKQSTDCLRKEILSVRDYDKLDPRLVWARSMVLRAIAHSEHEADLLLEEAREILHRLHRTPSSMNIQDFMERNGLAAASGDPSDPSKSGKARTEVTWHHPIDPAGDASDEEKEDAPGGTNGTKLDNKGKAKADVWTVKTQLAEEPVSEEGLDEDLTKVDHNAAAFSKTSTFSPKETVPLDVGRSEEQLTTIKGKISSYHDRDEDYSPSPPQTLEGSYYPMTSQFPPPPLSPIGDFTQQPTNTQAPPENAAPIPPYDLADYSGQQLPNHNSQQKLSKIYVTIDEASSEPEAVKPMVDRDKKQSGLSHTSDREPELEVPITRSKHRY
jgi:hypothetical protein